MYANDWIESLNTLKLPKLALGSHDAGDGELCAMEMVAFIERLPHSDSPPCTDPMLALTVQRVNDVLLDEHRDRLLPLLPRLVGTNEDGHPLRQSYTPERVLALLEYVEHGFHFQDRHWAFMRYRGMNRETKSQNVRVSPGDHQHWASKLLTMPYDDATPLPAKTTTTPVTPEVELVTLTSPSGETKQFYKPAPLSTADFLEAWPTSAPIRVIDDPELAERAVEWMIGGIEAMIDAGPSAGKFTDVQVETLQKLEALA